MKIWPIGLALLCIGSPALAEVKNATPAGFELSSTATVAGGPAEVWFLLGQIGQWWSGEHSYSGNAANLTLATRAGACFCERVPQTGATIEHGRVVYAEPNSTLRLQAALGPLQAEAVTGTLTWTLKKVEGGTQVTQTYVVGGYIRGGAQKLAPAVDKVMTAQLAGLKARMARRAP